MPSPATRAWLLALPVVVLFAPAFAGTTAAQSPAADCARRWLSGAAAIEAFLRTAEVLRLEDIPVGVTRPRRAFLEPGGPVESVVWKPIRPGMRNGFRESYKAEVAAYELDKVLALQMIPPTVERRFEGDLGAAVFWASGARSFKDLGGVPGQNGVQGPPAAVRAAWNRQLVRAKMFDNLIANTDPNLGNWLVDEDWHVILVDHSRSFTTSKSLVHGLTQVDRDLWQRILALDEAALTAALGQWLRRGEIRAVLERRGRMQKAVEQLVATRGDAVFIR